MMHYVTDFLISQGPFQEVVLLTPDKSREDMIEEIEDFCALTSLFVYREGEAISLPEKEGRRLLVVLDSPTFSDKIEGCDEVLLCIEEKNISPEALPFAPSALWEKLHFLYSSLTIAYLRTDKEPEVLSYKAREEAVELSIILPVYNVAPYLPQCIESLLKWNAPYVEYLFVDDGSPDNSADIISAYAKKDPRIVLLQKKNGGCASARNYGLKHARGRYIGFVDSDDFVEPEMFDKLFHRALDGNYDIAYCGFKYFYNETGTSENVLDNMDLPFVNGTHDLKLIDSQIAYRRIAIWRAIYSRRLLEENHIAFHEDLPRFDDLPFKVMTQAKANSVVCVPEYYYNYRLDRPGQDVSANDKKLFVHFDIFAKLDAFFQAVRDVNQLEYYAIVKLDTHAWALSKIKQEFEREYLLKAREDMLAMESEDELTKIINVYGNRAQKKALKKILSAK